MGELNVVIFTCLSGFCPFKMCYSHETLVTNLPPWLRYRLSFAPKKLSRTLTSSPLPFMIEGLFSGVPEMSYDDFK